MPTLQTVVDGYVCTQEFDAATLGRLQYWVDQLGNIELADITAEEVDAAIVRLAERGRLRPGRGQVAERTGKPLAPSTLNRYINQLASVFKYARRVRLLPRTFVPPTHGIEREPEPVVHDRYFRPEEVERLIKVARLLDTRWGKFEALVVVAYHTGLRRSNVLHLKWADIDLQARTATVRQTKNGDPIVSPLSQRAIALLKKLPNKHPDRYVFENKAGQPRDIKSLWKRICTEARIDLSFHALRHGCGHALAQAGTTQGLIMKIMGHRSLAASARYMHASTDDKRNVIDLVFDNG